MASGTNLLEKEFTKALKSFGHSRNTSIIFSDWLEVAAISMHQIPYHSGEFARDEDFERLEERYLEVSTPSLPVNDCPF